MKKLMEKNGKVHLKCFAKVCAPGAIKIIRKSIILGEPDAPFYFEELNGLN